MDLSDIFFKRREIQIETRKKRNKQKMKQNKTTAEKSALM